MNVLRLFILTLFSLTAHAQEINAAVASSFLLPMRDIVTAFEHQSQHRVSIASGSSGKLYAQIIQGAPFDVFLSADQEKPKALLESGHGISGSRFTYAQGSLVVIATNGLTDDPKALLSRGEFNRLAIANPRLAPYGAAAVETLKALTLWDAVSQKLVIGESVGQAYHFVISGNAQLAFIARAQVYNPQRKARYWPVPTKLHSPIYQDAVLVKKGSNQLAAKQLLAFLQSEQALIIMDDYGYQPAGQQ